MRACVRGAGGCVGGGAGGRTDGRASGRHGGAVVQEHVGCSASRCVRAGGVEGARVRGEGGEAAAGDEARPTHMILADVLGLKRLFLGHLCARRYRERGAGELRAKARSGWSCGGGAPARHAAGCTGSVVPGLPAGVTPWNMNAGALV